MAKYLRTEGICLRRLDYSDTSQVAWFLTPDAGRLSFIAKGQLRAPKRGVRAGFELLGRYDLVYTTRPSGALDNLTESTLREPFQGMRRRLERILCGYYAAELTLNFTAEGDPCPALYALLVQSLRHFEAGERLGLSVLLLEIGTLRHNGACPAFEACVECGRDLPSTGRVLFSPDHGGPLCRSCGRRLHEAPGGHASLVKVERLTLLAGLASVQSPEPRRVRARPEEIVAASRLLRFHIRYMLGRELRMWKYLQDRHLSRALRRARSHVPAP